MTLRLLRSVAGARIFKFPTTNHNLPVSVLSSKKTFVKSHLPKRQLTSGSDGSTDDHNLKSIFDKLKDTRLMNSELEVPHESDIVIIGGGAIGMSAAFWMKQHNPAGYSVTLIEKDPTYCKASSTLSVGGIRQQFGLKENIQMSLFSAEFFRKIKEHLSVLSLDPPDVCFNHQGYLFLATKEGEQQLKENYKTQISLGAKVDYMNRDKLKLKFPWMNVDDIEAGCYGVQNEGWFDPWLLLASLKVKAASLGVNLVTGEVVGFETEATKINSPVTQSFENRPLLRSVKVKTPNGKVHDLKFAMVLNCAGAWSGEIAKMAGIGVEKEGALSFALPVEPRLRYVYVFHCPDGPGLQTPMLIDPSGVYVRREGLGGMYVCGASPPEGMPEPDPNQTVADEEFFKEHIWPTLARRVPAFECLKLTGSWCGHYDYNYFDGNLIIGNHPYHRNFFMATGCTGHGIQHSPAIGQAIMEYMLKDEYVTIDLSRMSFDRIMDGEKLMEPLIV